MNLVLDPWIPVRLRSGERRRIRPADLTVTMAGAEAVLALDLPRPDFQGAVFEFLVGLLQTALRVQDDDEWRDLYEAPPSPSELAAAFDRQAHAFALTGAGPCFAQDVGLALTDEARGIQQLFMDAPGENTVKQNADLFVRAGGVGLLCAPCAAAALYTLQANASAGGPGTALACGAAARGALR